LFPPVSLCSPLFSFLIVVCRLLLSGRGHFLGFLSPSPVGFSPFSDLRVLISYAGFAHTFFRSSVLLDVDMHCLRAAGW